jgi:hypothetical protein
LPIALWQLRRFQPLGLLDRVRRLSGVGGGRPAAEEFDRPSLLVIRLEREENRLLGLLSQLIVAGRGRALAQPGGRKERDSNLSRRPRPPLPGLRAGRAERRAACCAKPDSGRRRRMTVLARASQQSTLLQARSGMLVATRTSTAARRTRHRDSNAPPRSKRADRRHLLLEHIDLPHGHARSSLVACPAAPAEIGIST